MPGTTSISYLFPPDRIHEPATWRFVLHFKAPRLFAERARGKAVARLQELTWNVIHLPDPLPTLRIDPKTNTLDVPVEVAEQRRRQPNALSLYESDIWKLYGHLIELGFGDLYYEAVDWK